MNALSWSSSIYIDGVFDPIQELEKTQDSKTNQHQYPVDSINVVADTKPRSTSSWGFDLYAQELCYSSLINHSSLDNIVTGIGLFDQAQQVRSTTSLDHSLDCLQSASNSNNTSTSVEDNAVSVTFSDCRNLLSCSATGAAADSDYREIHQMIPQKSSGQTKPKSCKRSKGDDNGSQFSLFHQDDSLTTESNSFELIYGENQAKSKKRRTDKPSSASSNISFQNPSSSTITSLCEEESDPEVMAQMKEMIYRAAAFRPVNLGLEIVDKPRRKNVRISDDPQTAAARHRRERISEKIRVLQRLVPGGTKMDTATMLDEAANYLKFLREQIKTLEKLGHKLDSSTSLLHYPPQTNSFSSFSPLFNQTYFPFPQKP